MRSTVGPIRRSSSYAGMTTLRSMSRPSPGPGLAVVPDEPARIARAEAFQDGDHRGDGFLRIERRLSAAHVGAVPARIQGDDGEAVAGELPVHEDRPHVEGGLAAAVGVGEAA